MYSGMVVVWDPDQKYAEKLREYLERQGGLGAGAAVFADLESVKQAVETGQAAVVLVGSEAESCAWLKDVPVVVLREERPSGQETEYTGDGMRSQVYKYQSAREIWKKVKEELEDFSQIHTEKRQRKATGQPAGIRGIYAPLGGCLKTSLGLVLGCMLAEERRCLFVSLEAHAGFRTLFGRQYATDLSDLLAAIRHGSDLAALLPSALQSFGKLQYIPPVIWPVDVREAEKSEIKELLRQLARSGLFDEILVDVGQDLACPEQILAMCDQIYQPEKSDVFSQAKLAEYDCYLRVSGYENLRKRIRRIPVSAIAPDTEMALDQWQRWEQMIPLVRQILEEASYESASG